PSGRTTTDRGPTAHGSGKGLRSRMSALAFSVLVPCPVFGSAAAPHTADRRSYRECMTAARYPARTEHRGGVDLTTLDQPLGPEAGATKRDLVDYLDAVAERMLP